VSVQLNHTIVWCRDKQRSATFLTEILGLSPPVRFGPFLVVELGNGVWVCAAAGGPFPYTPTRAGKTKLGLEEAHRDLRIAPDEFDEVAAELGRTLDFAKVPGREKEEVLAAFAAHKNEVTAGYLAAVESGRLMPA